MVFTAGAATASTARGFGAAEAQGAHGVGEVDADHFEPASRVGALGLQIACPANSGGDLDERLDVSWLGERAKLRAERI